jgi:trimeric autotransporter adhesin
MKRHFVSLLLFTLLTALISSCGSGSSGTVSLVAIEVTPVDPVIALGTTTQLKATGIYSDNSKKDLTSSVDWDSTDDSVASVHNGFARSFGQGASTIKAVLGSISGSRTLTVKSAALVSIHVTPVNPKAALGTSTQFTATGIFSDDSAQDLTSQVTWNSSSPSVAFVSNAADSLGLATSFEMGTTSISAVLGSVTGSTTLTVTSAILVSIQVTPVSPSIAKGTTRQFAATGIYSDQSTQDLTKQVTWSSSSPSVASVSNAAGSNGLAAALAVGKTGVGATLGFVYGTTTLDVTAATLVSIELSPADSSISKGTTLQFAATGIYSDTSTQDLTKQVTWNSSNSSVASVSNAAGSNGLASALGIGSATISSTLDAVSGTTTLGVTAVTLVSIQLDPTDSVTSMDINVEFTATGIYSDNSAQDLTQQVTWKSSDERVASLGNAEDSRGLAIPAGTGSTAIDAILGDVSGTAKLTVSDARLVSIEVKPDGESIPKGKTLQFTATGSYSDGMTLDVTKSAVWESSDEKAAIISNAKKEWGLATGGEAGKTAITATLSKISGSATLIVSGSMADSPVAASADAFSNVKN